MHQQVVGRQVTVGQAVPGERVERRGELLPQARQQRARGAGLGQPRRGGAVGGADKLQQHLGAGDLHRVRDRHPGGVQPAERGELRPGPLARDHLLAERAPAGGRAVDPGLPDPAALQVAGVAVEQPVPRVPVALGREQAGPVGAGDVAADQVDVGFLAGLQDAELRVDRGEIGDQPLRVRPGTALGRGALVPGRPAVAFRQAVGGIARVLGLEPGPVPVALGVSGLVVELAALVSVAPSAGAGDSVVVEVRAVAHGWCSSGGKWSGQG